MTHEEIIKREDGTQYKITVKISLPFGQNASFCHRIETRGKGKRKWESLPEPNFILNLTAMTHAEALKARDDIKRENELKYVTKEEIYTAKLTLWEQMKPEL